MIKYISILLLLVVLTSSDVTVSDVKFTERFHYKNNNFVLNGVGIREKYYIDLYVLGLYLKNKSKDVNKILNANEPQLFRLVCVSSLITPEKFNIAMENAFYNATNGHPEVYADEIRRLKIAFSGTWLENDEFIIYYTPKIGLQLHKNNKLLDTFTSGIGFKTAIMKVWLGPQSVSESLKQQILGND